MLDYTQIIQECKELFKAEVEKKEKPDLSKDYIINLIYDYFKAMNENKSIAVYSFLSYISIWATLITIFIEVIKIKLSDNLSMINLSLSSVGIVLLLSVIWNLCKKAISKTEYKTIEKFIMENALYELKLEFEEEKRNKLLETEISVQLKEDELEELLKEDTNKKVIKTYDRTISLERRKRNRVRKIT